MPLSDMAFDERFLSVRTDTESQELRSAHTVESPGGSQEAQLSIRTLDSQSSEFQDGGMMANTKTGDPLSHDDLEEGDDANRGGGIRGVAAKLHVQDIMLLNTPFAVPGQRMATELNGLQKAARRIQGAVWFDLVSIFLIVVDMACVVLADGATREESNILKAISLIITILFVLELAVRIIAQLGRGFSWTLALEALVVSLSSVDVLLQAFTQESTIINSLRPARGIRIIRAMRGLLKLAKYSTIADMVFEALSRSLRPLLAAAVTLVIICMGVAVMMTIQVPGLLSEADEDLRQAVMERFGNVGAAAWTLTQAIGHSGDLGTVCLAVFHDAKQGSWTAALFLATLIYAVLLLALACSGLIAGVFLSQMVFIQGDASEHASRDEFLKHQKLVVSIDEAFSNAKYDASDHIDWDDVRKVLLKMAANKDREDDGCQQDLQRMLGSAPDKTDDPSETKSANSETEGKRLTCRLEHEGMTAHDVHAAYEELAKLGVVSVEEFILCLFRHVTISKSVDRMSMNHQQNKVDTHVKHYGSFLAESLKSVQLKVTSMAALVPEMIQQSQAAAHDLQELVKLEDHLEARRKALRELIKEGAKEDELDTFQDETTQERKEVAVLNEELKVLEAEVEQLVSSEPQQAGVEAIEALADQLADNLWQVITEELDAAKSAGAKSSHGVQLLERL